MRRTIFTGVPLLLPIEPRLGDTASTIGGPHPGDKHEERPTTFGVLIGLLPRRGEHPHHGRVSGRALKRQAGVLVLFEVAVVVPTLALIAGLILVSDVPFKPVLLLWSLLIGLIELMPVPAWRGLTISVGFPVLMMVAILYPPGTAGLITLLGMTDPRELRREMPIAAALFNRSQVALSVIAASVVFQSTSDVNSSPTWLLLASASAAAVADYLVNASLVTVYMTLRSGIRPARVIRELRIGNIRDFLISYLGLGILGLALAKFFEAAGVWALPACLAPLIFARQTFFRSRALEEAHVELQEREAVLRELSNTMAEERADERLQIAGYLHDDLAQVLFRLSLQVDIAKKLLDKGDLPALQTQLDKIRQSKQDTSERVRALIRDLHRSPLGAKGLAESLESLTDEVGRDSGIEFHHDVEDIDLPAPIALLIFHIAREGVMNALKHANATNVSITVHEDDDDIVLTLMDDGVGFDTGVPGPEGHFGMAMLRERAKVGGGTIEIQSAPGQGTTIMVRFPTALLQRDHEPGTEPASSNGPGRASPDMTGTTSQAAEGSRDSVPA
jgi:signal transduction histidine kinase